MTQKHYFDRPTEKNQEKVKKYLGVSKNRFNFALAKQKTMAR